MNTAARFLLENRAWAAEVDDHDSSYFSRVSAGQRPAVFWIGCADSRVPAEAITNAAPGELFVHRSIANLALRDDNSLMSALQYAVDVLAVRHVIVCGHDGCGGVRAALTMGDDDASKATDDDDGEHLARRIAPLRALYLQRRHEVDAARDGSTADPIAPAVDRLVTLNVTHQVQSLAGTGIVQRAWARGQALSLHGWVYGLRDGRLRKVVAIDHEAALQRAA